MNTELKHDLTTAMLIGLVSSAAAYIHDKIPNGLVRPLRWLSLPCSSGVNSATRLKLLLEFCCFHLQQLSRALSH